MSTNVFIAPKIKVGFQKRSDTFTGKLAYVIYYDEKGKLRKEKSWESWRDKKIAPQEFENTPIDGFTLNKDVQRSREWFGSGRNMIRIHDPRGFEFEVTCENLIEILMHTDCLRRGLIGQFVYAWFGADWSWDIVKDKLCLNTGWSVSAAYDRNDVGWYTGPEVSLQYYTSGNAFIYAGVNYDFLSKESGGGWKASTENALTYSFGIGIAF